MNSPTLFSASNNEPSHLPALSDVPENPYNQQPSEWRTGVEGTSDQISKKDHIAVPGVGLVSKKDVDKKPWKYRGYPNLCDWMSTSSDLFILRRFDALSVRVALRMQDRIVCLEEELREEDDLCRRAIDEVSDSGTFRDDPRPRRVEILEELTVKLGEYQRFIIDCGELKARPNASSINVRNVRTWLRNANEPIEPKEVAFVGEREDLIPILHKAVSPSHRFINRYGILVLPSCFRKKKVNERLYAKGDFENDTTIYGDVANAERVMTSVIIIVGLGMLIGPLWWLQYLAAKAPNSNARLGTITGFLTLFTILLSVLTVAKPFEVLAATAAYAAVLMVFLQLGSNGGNGSGP